ncbi:MAG TPA: VUT family protein, partial [Candidatus Binatia bacterium]|nr:VUT family protein [Candidatus Binatia bacterium]
AYAFVVLYLSIQVPAASFSPVNDMQFRAVFGQSLWIIVGSIIAFGISQIVDVGVFWLVRHRTGGKHLWLRATGNPGFATHRQHRHHWDRVLAAGQGQNRRILYRCGNELFLQDDDRSGSHPVTVFRSFDD